VNKDSLHGNATLSGVGKASGYTWFGSILQVRVVMYDHTGVAAQFKRHAFLPGLLLQVPAHRRAAGGARHFQTLVGNQVFSVAAGKREDVQGATRPSRLLDQLCEKQRGERTLLIHVVCGVREWADAHRLR
jgi:hypothetical protein